VKLKEALAWLNRHQFHGIKPGLERIGRLLSALGHPERKFPSVHIAGTNGKGSTAAILATALSAQGLKVGLYTSPHLTSVTERFRINGKEISEKTLAEILSLLRRETEALGLPITYFEITTAVAFLWFAEEGVDLAVIECGLGGRLDATNVCQPLVSVITTVAKDHTTYLGKTLKEIALEKAGIIKPGVPVVAGRLPPSAKEVVSEKARKTQSPLYLLGRDFKIITTRKGLNYYGLKTSLWGLSLSLEGPFQRENLAVALAALELLHEKGFPFEEYLLRKALREVFWPGRFEFWPVGSCLKKENTPRPFGPTSSKEGEMIGLKQGYPRGGILFDGAHNEDGLKALASALRQRGLTEYTLIFGTTNEGGDKPYLRMLKKLLPGARKVFLCEPPGPRNPVTLKEWAEELRGKDFKVPIKLCKDLEKALEEALKTGLPVLVTGSLYLVGALRSIWTRLNEDL